MQTLEESPEVYANLEQLTQRVTGLKISRVFSKGYEQFHLASYGPGGFTALHHDWVASSRSDWPHSSIYVRCFAKDLTIKSVADRSRAKSLLKMSQLEGPELGGGTGFPRLEFAAPALKGSAILWFNVNSAGEPATRTIHGSCPVVFGHKWIALKWIQYIEQDHLMCDQDLHAGVDYLRNGRLRPFT